MDGESSDLHASLLFLSLPESSTLTLLSSRSPRFSSPARQSGVLKEPSMDFEDMLVTFGFYQLPSCVLTRC